MNKMSSQQPFDSFAQAGLASARIVLDALQELSNVASTSNPLLTLKTQSCCEIPPPCWLPQCFGEFASKACPCGTALLRIQVTNCQAVSSEVKLAIETDNDVTIKITPDRAVLGPMECKWFTLAVSIPEDACQGECYDLMVWVRGCNEHYARWKITVTDGFCGTCLEKKIEDCPDYVHHWYDHFYCNRPCFSMRQDRQDRKNQETTKTGPGRSQ